VIWCCGSLGPKLLRFDLREESRKVEEQMGIRPAKQGILSAWQPIGLRAYRISQDAQVVGKTVAEAEKSVTKGRLFVERIRRGNKLFAPLGTTVLEVGDTIAVLGRTEILVELLGPKASEVADPELLDIPVASFDVYVTKKDICGRTLQEIATDTQEAHSVLLRNIKRAGRSIAWGVNTAIARGDTLQVTGSTAAVERFAGIVGTVIHPAEEADFAVIGIATALGVLVGAILTIPIGSLRIALGTSVGTLLAGVLVGWSQSVRPWFGRIPDAAILFMRSLGLAAFVAMIGLKAGPIFLSAVKQYGFVLFLGGIVVTLVPLIAGLLVGRYVLKLNPALLIGGIAGAQTMIAGVAAAQEKSGSAVATLGYSYTVAFGHILLTTWGTIIVFLVGRAYI
jgi:putative transport protein